MQADGCGLLPILIQIQIGGNAKLSLGVSAGDNWMLAKRK